MKLPVYLDYSATCPVDPRVAEKMVQYMTMDGIFANPASRSHRYGWQAEEAVDTAREQIADLINADPREIVFTSGATESDNLAIKGAALQYAEQKGKHIITSLTEHKAVLDTCQALEKEGFEVTYLKPDSNGLIGIETLKAAMRDDTVLVSIMHVNNEIGVIQDIAAMGELCRQRDILFHVDAAQSAGKLLIDVQNMAIDLISISAHKMYGPKGIGALYVRRKPRLRLAAQIHGGGHERGFRSGTLPTHQIVGFGEACRIAKEEMESDHQHAMALRERFLDKIKDLPLVTINGDLTQRVANNLNLAFDYVDGESLLMSLKDIAVSSGSACTSASVEPSYVLQAIGLERELAHSALRLSFGRYTTQEDVDFAAEHLCQCVTRLRDISPLWQTFQQENVS